MKKKVVNISNIESQNAEDIILKELDAFVSAFLSDEKMQLCRINSLSSKINTKLGF